MRLYLRCARRSARFITFAVVMAAATSLAAQAPAPKPAPKPAAPRTAPAPKPAARPAAKPAAKPAAAPAPAPVPAPAPPPPAPEDVRFKTSYTTGGQKTETVTFVKGARERFEFQDMILLKQHDERRNIQISRAANTYLVTPDGAPSAPPVAAGAAVAPPKPPGVVMVSTTIVDTGERKAMFGQQARHVKTMIDKQPMPGACDATKQRIETDGWYIDAPKAMAAQPQTDPARTEVAGVCLDQINATHNGDPAALGFPIAYTTTVSADTAKPAVVSMEVTEFEVTTLDAALFEIPQGLNAALNMGELSKALSNANEAKLVAADSAPAPTAAAPRVPGVPRIGVAEFTNKTSQTVDTRGLRSRLITDLVVAKFDAVPMAAAPPAELQKRAAEFGYDYVLLAEVADLKVSKPGAIGGMLRAASRVTGSGGDAKDITESSIDVKLVQPDGKNRLSATTKGKDGSAFTMQTGLGLARFAGTMYMSMMMGPSMMYRLNGLGGANLGGMGMLGSPDLFRTQTSSLGAAGLGMGVDGTAGAAAFLLQQAMAMNGTGGLVGAGQGPSYDASLGEALDGAVKAVTKSLQPK